MGLLRVLVLGLCRTLAMTETFFSLLWCTEYLTSGSVNILKTTENYLKIQLDPSLGRTPFSVLGGSIWVGLMQSTSQPQECPVIHIYQLEYDFVPQCVFS